MVSISYHVVLKMIKFPITLFLKLNIHHVTNTQYLQPSNCWEDNCSFNPQLLLYKFRNFIILFYINLITTFNQNPTQTHCLIWLAIFYLQLYTKYSWYLLISSCCLPQSDHIFLCQLPEQSIKYSSYSPRLCHNTMRSWPNL